MFIGSIVSNTGFVPCCIQLFLQHISNLFMVVWVMTFRAMQTGMKTGKWNPLNRYPAIHETTAHKRGRWKCLFFFLLLWTHSSYPGHHQHHDKANISTQWSLGHGAWTLSRISKNRVERTVRLQTPADRFGAKVWCGVMTAEAQLSGILHQTPWWKADQATPCGSPKASRDTTC